jgi:alpha-D-xyloside xylohydrolase
MKFTDGYWHVREGFRVEHPQEAYSVEADRGPIGLGRLTVLAPTRLIEARGDVLNRSALTITAEPVATGVIRVTLTHHAGGVARGPHFGLLPQELPESLVGVETGERGGAPATLTAGPLTMRVDRDGPLRLRFLTESGDGTNPRELTGCIPKGIGLARDCDGVTYLHQQLDLGVGVHVYGLGERFGPLVRNGQVVDIWNADGGTASEQAYKNVPFYLTDGGYGVFVDHPGKVSFEVGSEVVSRVQFSVAGQSLSYLVIAGAEPKQILDRYTALTGRPPLPPEWSFGLWLSTSFTTDYDEATVTSYVDGMIERGIPLSVFHFDCFWMRGFNWCDFVWDPQTFPDPAGMLGRLHARGVRICVWINPYVAQHSPLFAEGVAAGHLLRRADGSVWQTDAWQAGMGIVDFTSPAAGAWFAGKLKVLLDMGVDCFKTDFGERIPTDVVWSDGSDPERMHNYYAQLYNRTVFDLLVAERGEGDAVLFARSATAGGQQFPVHWGGDCESTFVSMAETLRGGLSLGMSGFGFWSHDIGGFEGTPDPAVFKRWLAFGLLSSHSRLHGSGSVRVPWAFDEESVGVARKFARLKQQLLPYLLEAAREAHEHGTPVMRAMLLEFPDDPTAALLDRQYMLGPDLLVAPVFSAEGDVTYYLPEGEWTHLLTGATATGPRWIQERHGFESLPLYVRPGATVILAPDTAV